VLKPLGPPAGSTTASETFGDLVFCALIVLVLFVLALSIEVSQRVRAAEAPVARVDPEAVAKLSPEEIAELSQRLRQQQAAISELREKLRAEKARVSSQVAALSGEQRFTGAREPASFCIGVDYVRERYYFVPSRELNHADKRLSGESTLEYVVRKKRELSTIARNAKRGRSYSPEETIRVYRAFSQYQEVIPENDGYRIETSPIGITYSTWLSDKLTLGIDSDAQASEAIVVGAMQKVYENRGDPKEQMYPQVKLDIREGERVSIGGVDLSARDLRDILVSISGRGALVDLVGIGTTAPEWLREGALIPAGYIGKVPKVPD